MSFGAATRFETREENGKVGIFWNQEGEKKKPKKFSYKKKGQGFPLRAQAQAKEEKEARNKQNQRTVNKPARPAAINRGAQKDGPKSSSNKGEKNTVTLKEQQLNTILSLVTDKFNGMDVEASSGDAVPVVSGAKVTSSTDGPGESILNLIPSSRATQGPNDVKHVQLEHSQIPGLGGDVNSSRARQAPGDVKHVQLDHSQIPGLGGNDSRLPPAPAAAASQPPSEGDKTQPSAVPKAPMTKAELKRLQWEQEKAEEVKLAAQRTGQAAVAVDRPHPALLGTATQPGKENTPAATNIVPTKHMTKAELKRLQWEKERNEAAMATEVSPWGKPGAGAPMNEAGSRPVEHDVDYLAMATASVSASAPQDARSPRQPLDLHQVQDFSLSMSGGANIPPAMRTSLAFGVAAHDRYSDTKKEEQRQWLEELNRQKEEKRLQKEREKEKEKQQNIQDTWADKLSYNQPGQFSSSPSQPPGGATIVPGPPEQPRVNSAPLAANMPSLEDQVISPRSTYLRGQNALADPAAQKDQEEKRLRHLEHQEYIKKQVEEKQRLKREEQERQRKEEQEEEARLQKDRDQLQERFQMEQDKQKKKIEEEERRVQALKEAMDQAHEEAMKEKHEKRMKHMRQAGHDVHNLEANFEAKITPRYPYSTPRTTHVEPVSVPGLDLSSGQGHHAQLTSRSQGHMTSRSTAPVNHVSPREASVQQHPQQHQQQYPQHQQQHPQHNPQLQQVSREEETDAPYTENRVLTPTVLRTRHSGGREFGTQTDEALLVDFLNTADREDSDVQIEYKPKNTKKVRLKSADTNQQETKRKREPVKIKERPRWGTSNPKAKKPVKQSERDPFYAKRKKAQEKRQQELMKMVEANTQRVTQRTKSSASQKARSRSPSNGKSRSVSRGRGRSQSPTVRKLKDNSEKDPEEFSETSRQKSRESKRTHGNDIETSRGDSRKSRIDSHRSEGHRAGDKLDSHRSHSPPAAPGRTSGRSRSPPIPSVRNRSVNQLTTAAQTPGHQSSLSTSGFNIEANNYHQFKRRQENGGLGPDSAETSSQDQFVPFLRSSARLDPVHADSPLPLSRENTAQERARKAHLRSLQPANYGSTMEYYDDRRMQDIQTPTAIEKDPLINPSVLKEHPTERQKTILQHLSDIRQGLIQKQREIEICLSPSEINRIREASDG